jgi:VCBS repeat-containing protein
LKAWPVKALATLVLALLMAALAFASPAHAATVENGDFESGTLTGWTVVDQEGSNGSWYSYSSENPPPQGCPPPGEPPPQGIYAATTHQSGPSSHVLYQDIALEPSATHSLSFTLYYDSFAPIASPDTLDRNTGPNQQYRVDIMKPDAPVFSVDPDDVLATVFRTTEGDPQTLSPTQMDFDLSAFAGQTVRLRFAEAVTQNCFAASVDDVKVTTVLDTTNVPPVAVDDSYAVDEDGTLDVPAPGVLDNDTDANSANLIANLATDVSNGTLTLNPDGSFTYKPKADFNGTDSFTYEVCDNGDPALCDTATVTMSVSPTPDACTINGTGKDDVLRGTANRDVICGGGGNDTIRGLEGNDLIRGGVGNDTIYGGAGNDTLRGGDGRDELYGSGGDDRLYGGAGTDLLDGGTGNNMLQQ